MDTNIHWRIEKYDSKTNADLDERGPVRVCHDVPVDIGGVQVKQQIFDVEYCNNDLILRRPWERMIWAEYVNEDDDSYTVTIKSLVSRRMIQFCAVRAEHEGNREFIRHVKDKNVGYNSLKV